MRLVLTKIFGISFLLLVAATSAEAQSNVYIGVGSPDTDQIIRVYGNGSGYSAGHSRARRSTYAQRRYNPLRAGGPHRLSDSPTEKVLVKHQKEVARYHREYDRWEATVARKIARAKAKAKRDKLRKKRRLERARRLAERKKARLAKRSSRSASPIMRARRGINDDQPTVQTKSEISREKERALGEGRIKTRKSLGESLRRAFFNFN